MARTEARLSVEIWDDEDFVARSPGAQRLYMFLLSQRDLAYTGVIPLRERRWASSAPRLTEDDIKTAVNELDEARFVVVDRDAEELLVRTFMRGDKVYRQPQLMRAAQEQLPMVTSRRIKAALVDELRKIAQIEGLHDASAESVQAMLAFLGHPLGKDAPIPSGHPAEHPSDHPAEHPSDHPAGQGAGHPDSTLREGFSGEVAARTGERGNTSLLALVNSPNPLPLSPDPHPQKTTSSSSSGETREAKQPRGTRIPDDFQVTADMVEWAREKAPHVDGRRETEKFINYWRAKSGKDATKLDWKATWRNWMLNAEERAPRLPVNQSRASPGATSNAPRAIPADERCPRHPNYRAGRCGPCRSENLAAANLRSTA